MVSEKSDLLQLINNILLPRLRQSPLLFKHLNQIQNTFQYRKLKILQKQISSNFGTLNQLSHLLWSKLALTALKMSPFTIKIAQNFLKYFKLIQQAYLNDFDLSINLIPFVSSVNIGMIKVNRLDDLIQYIQILLYIQMAYQFFQASQSLAFATQRCKQILVVTSMDQSYTGIKSHLDYLKRIKNLGVGDFKSIIESTASMLLPKLRWSDIQDSQQILRDLLQLDIEDEDLKSRLQELLVEQETEIPTFEAGTYSKFQVKYKKQIIFDDSRPFYSRTNQDPKIFVYFGKIQIQNQLVQIAIKEYLSTNQELLQRIISKQDKIIQKCTRTNKQCFLKQYGRYFQQTKQGVVCGFVMQKCQGSLIDQITQRAKRYSYYTQQEFFLKVTPIVQGFAYLDHCRIFHNDVKPHNLFLSKSGSLKIADFNISDIWNFDESQTITTTKMCVNIPIQGTDGYMVPQIQKWYTLKRVDPSLVPDTVQIQANKIDIYGLGLVFLQMLTLQNIRGLNEESRRQELIQKIERLDYSQMLKGILLRMLEVDPKKRIGMRDLLPRMPKEDTSIIQWL